MDKKLVVSPSPHIHGAFSTKRLMGDVLIALIPAFIVSVIVYGVDALVVTRSIRRRLRRIRISDSEIPAKGDCTIGNYSAVVTGVLLGFNLPSTLPSG